MQNFKIRIFQLILIIILIHFSSSYFIFNYSTSIKLYTSNIFVIHQLGVSFCNENLTDIISDEVVFDESSRIESEEDLSKVELVVGESNIICLIKNRIHIFNDEGHVLYSNNYESVVQSDAEYYTLVYYKKDSNYLQFLVGYISNYKLYLNLYGYKQSTQTITLLYNLETENAIENQGLSCHNMNYSYSSGVIWTKINYVNIILCLYTSVGEKMNMDFYKINDDYSIVNSDKRENKYFFLEEQTNYIKGDLLSGNNTLLFGWITQTGIPYYRLYNIQDDNYKIDMKKFSKTYCQLKAYGFKIKYYPEKNEVMYTCLLESNGWTVPKANILVETLGVYGYQTNYTYKYNDCQFDGYSIIYHEDKAEYYIISNAYCQNETKSFCMLFGDYKPKEEDNTEEENENTQEEEKKNIKEEEKVIIKEQEKSNDKL